LPSLIATAALKIERFVANQFSEITPIQRRDSEFRRKSNAHWFQAKTLMAGFGAFILPINGFVE
jgi:hypothetical protein